MVRIVVAFTVPTPRFQLVLMLYEYNYIVYNVSL